MRTGHYYVALLFGTLLILFYLLANIMRHMRDLAAGRFQNPVSAAEHSALPGGGPGKRQED
jgi:TRAP-type C4-dicarboxylate transport system permease small subunit